VKNKNERSEAKIDAVYVAKEPLQNIAIAILL
jgi:hypothetical protein